MASVKDVHLVILIHGLWGSPAHLAVAKEELEAAYRSSHQTSTATTKISGPSDDPVIESTVEGGNEDLVVMIAGGMTSQLTYDGVDVCASRVAWEVDQEVSRLEREGKRVKRFSVTGYSLGGLVARYLVGLLHSRTPSFFEKHHPVSFSTIATPHLGIPRYNTFLSTSLVWLGSKLLSRSGEQLYVTDRYSNDDQRPLLEIMADPDQVFVQALETFDRLRIYGNAIKDDTVPYPSAAIETTDHFTEWAEIGIEVESDADGIMRSWRKNGEIKVERKKGWSRKLGTLPPVLRYRYPFNYIILLLMPIMVPLLMLLLISRSLLDTRQSQRRLQKLAQTSLPPNDSDSDSSPSTPVPSPLGLSITHLRQVIRSVERSIESKVIDIAESPDIEVDTWHKKTNGQNAAIRTTEVQEEEDSDRLQVYMKDSQLRMALWLNKLPWMKTLTWYPETSNSHAIIIVRDPAGFPAHNRGRGLLKRWAQGVLGLEGEKK